MVGSYIASYFLDLKIVFNSSSMGLRALRALTGFTGPAYGTLRATGSTGPRALRAAYGTTGPTGPEGPYSNLNHDPSTMNTTSDAKRNASLSFSETKSYQNLKTQCPWPIATTEPILHRTSNVGRHSRCCFPRPEKLELAGAECWTATSRKLQVGSNQPNQSPYLAAGKTNPKRWDF